MKSFSHLKILIIPTLLFISLTGCFSSRQMITDSAVGLFQDLALSVNRQSDLALVRQGIPSYLLLIDGMVQANPGNQDLLLAGAQAYASYASILGEE